ncbi:MAG: hypothetical protein HYZ15_04905 [Sphingobacteriales bacterium]|nr:hypothetical protein [Sphingobacteriales bacterium]
MPRKLTENEVVSKLADFLINEGWDVIGKSLGFEKGYDLLITKEGKTLAVEAKGATANKEAYNKVRAYFDGGQIKTHFGKALLKVLEIKTENPAWLVAIAQPDDDLVRKHTEMFLPYLKQIGIIHFWVGEVGVVSEIPAIEHI